MALQFASFRHIKTIWFGLKNGRDESDPTPCGVHAAIHLRNKWILRNVRCHTFCIINKPHVVVCWYIFPRPPRRRRGPIYRPRAHVIPRNGVAIFHHWHCNTSYRAHEHPPNGVAIRNISYIKTDRKKREANPWCLLLSCVLCAKLNTFVRTVCRFYRPKCAECTPDCA